MPVAVRHCDDSILYRTFVIPVSFETGEQVPTLRVRGIASDQDAILVSATYQVVKAFAATDAGTLTIKTQGGVTVGTANIAASTAIGAPVTVDISSATGAQKRVGGKQGDGTDSLYHTITASKTTPGGKTMVVLTYRLIETTVDA